MEQKIIEYLDILEKAKNHYRDISQKNKGINNEMEYFFEGQAVCCEKTINDLRKILDIKMCVCDGYVCTSPTCFSCRRWRPKETIEENKYDNGGYNNGRR